ncbi:MAG: hypothetical protein CMJ29_04605 [Phycisphaerae bacterium]|nr:hypothetical protein [Phycisphaerae bacterium]
MFSRSSYGIALITVVTASVLGLTSAPVHADVGRSQYEIVEPAPTGDVDVDNNRVCNFRDFRLVTLALAERIFTINRLYRGRPDLRKAVYNYAYDTNGDGKLDTSDLVAIVEFLWGDVRNAEAAVSTTDLSTDLLDFLNESSTLAVINSNLTAVLIAEGVPNSYQFTNSIKSTSKTCIIPGIPCGDSCCICKATASYTLDPSTVSGLQSLAISDFTNAALAASGSSFTAVLEGDVGGSGSVSGGAGVSCGACGIDFNLSGNMNIDFTVQGNFTASATITYQTNSSGAITQICVEDLGITDLALSCTNGLDLTSCNINIDVAGLPFPAPCDFWTDLGNAIEELIPCSTLTQYSTEIYNAIKNDLVISQLCENLLLRKGLAYDQGRRRFRANR